MVLFRRDSNDTPSEQQSQSSRTYQGNGVTINQPEGWVDKTVYTLTGPLEDGIQHNILVTIEEDVEFDSAAEYADFHITAMEEELKGYTVLKREEISLANGLPAYRAIFRWYPTDEMCIYQEQVFVLADGTAYKLTTTFTKKTRKTLGPQVERILMSFQPDRK
jgi:hypothetical protein